jgi:hypothetical protein
METAQLLEIMTRLDRQDRVRLYISLALQLTIRGREAYSYEPERAKETLTGLNELVHSVLGQALAVNSDSRRTPDEEVAARLFGFAQKLQVGAHLSLALDAIPRRALSSRDRPDE